MKNSALKKVGQFFFFENIRNKGEPWPPRLSPAKSAPGSSPQSGTFFQNKNERKCPVIKLKLYTTIGLKNERASFIHFFSYQAVMKVSKLQGKSLEESLKVWGIKWRKKTRQNLKKRQTANMFLSQVLRVFWSRGQRKQHFNEWLWVREWPKHEIYIVRMRSIFSCAICFTRQKPVGTWLEDANGTFQQTFVNSLV